MGFSAAESGFIFLFCAAVVQSLIWEVKYESTEICAFKGATVEIKCTYKYPTRINHLQTTVIESFWFLHSGNEPVDLRSQEKYTGRVIYNIYKTSCNLTISDLRESDSGEYKFRFITNQPGGSFTGTPGVVLTVSELDQHVSVKQYHKYQCDNRCLSSGHLTYVWYRNGVTMRGETSLNVGSLERGDSISCAVKGHEDFPSPPVCVWSKSCDAVTYNQRRVCAVKGSSAIISCVYKTYYRNQMVQSNFWFRPGSRPLSGYWQPSDLQYNHQYSDRVQVSERAGQSFLTINDLTENDSAEYRFTFKTYSFGWGNDVHGVTLTVTDLQVQVIRVSANQNVTSAELRCHSICSPAKPFIWLKNGQEISEGGNSYRAVIGPGDQISCAVKNQQHRSPAVYAPKPPSVSVGPSGDILAGSDVSLTCTSSANPAANYSWYKKDGPSALQPPSKDPRLVFHSIQSSDYGEYYCAAKNELGRTTSGHTLVDVKYAPKSPSVSVKPSGGIEEGTAVTLTCVSDANPAANHTWYKDNQMLQQAKEDLYLFPSIGRADSGLYRCTAENKYGHGSSPSVHVYAQYAPDVPSVSVSPSSELVEGASVNLTCSSDANPAANYTWYKEHEASPAASGPMLTIPVLRPEDGGRYYCRAQNGRGSQKSGLHSIVVSGSANSVVAASVGLLVLALILLICVALGLGVVVRRMRSPKQGSESRKKPDSRAPQDASPGDMQLAAFKQLDDQDELHYASVRFIQHPEEALYSNIMPTQPSRNKDEDEEDEEGEYSLVGSPGLGRQLAAEEASVVYSVVNKNYQA